MHIADLHVTWTYEEVGMQVMQQLLCTDLIPDKSQIHIPTHSSSYFFTVCHSGRTFSGQFRVNFPLAAVQVMVWLGSMSAYYEQR
jgi:hypothetical protein